KEKLDELKEGLDEHKKFLEKNKLFDDEILDKYEKLQNIFDELMDNELFEMVKKIQQKMNNDDDSNMEKILQDFENKQKDFEQALERTLGIFEEIRKEQKLSEISKKLKEALKQQEDILDDSDKNSSEELGTKEKQLSEIVKDIEKDVNDSKIEFDDEFKKLLQKLSDQMKDSKVSETMEQSSKKYKNSQKKQGNKSAEQAKKDLKKLMESFEKQKNSFMQKKKEQIIADFQKIFIQTILASKEQEQLNIDVKKIDRNSPHLHIFSSKEYHVFERIMSINKALIKLSKKTFFVDKAIVQELGRAFSFTNKALEHIENGSIRMARYPMKDSFVSLNRLAFLLQQTSDSMQGSKSGAGLEQYLKQLEKMAGQQKGLNSSMPQLGMAGKPSSMMDQMGKLAGRQQAIRKSLKQLQQEMQGNGKDPLGSLEKIANDMEKVINEMRRKKFNRRTIERQRKIQQRLLDASKSMRTRDKSKKRESEIGKQIDRESPFALPENLGNRESIIREIRDQLKNSNLSVEDKKEMEAYLDLLRNNESQGTKRNTSEN
ncbi:MAG: hypothetical protein U9N76_04680, partial [Candidatus Marinimicrobia bacterium]|nr:hypothetical protein [Candidatus Neomarinimicrobiota bacterium]